MKEIVKKEFVQCDLTYHPCQQDEIVTYNDGQVSRRHPDFLKDIFYIEGKSKRKGGVK